MTDTGDRCDYCGGMITDDAMGVVQETDIETNERVYFCDSFCRLASTRITRENRRGHNFKVSYDDGDTRI